MASTQTTTTTPGPAALRDRNLLQRLGSVALLLPVVLWAVRQGGWPLGWVVSVSALLGAVELAAMSLPGNRLLAAPAVLAAGAAPLLYLVVDAGGAAQHALWTGVLLMTLALRLFRPTEIHGAGTQVAQAMLAGLYPALMSHLVALREMGASGSWSGAGWLLLALGTAWGGDTGAYFGGRLLGRTKLMPRISPAKTREGFVAGLATSVGFALLFRATLLPQLSVGHALLLGLVGGLGGPLGDLVESLIKRAFDVKDSGHLIPGHGGMLDRIDALLFTGPLLHACVVLLKLA